MRKVFNASLPNFYVVDSPLEIRELLRKSSSLLFMAPLAMERTFIESALVAAGMNVHRIDEAMWRAQQVALPGDPHPGRVLTSFTTNSTGWKIDATEVQQVVFWGMQPFDHFAQCRARVRHNDDGVLITSPVPGYIYIGA